MRVLVACEFSGLVRDAFASLGHDAWSCDLLPTERPGPHIVGDVSVELRKPWDMVIAFPPCTYLSYAGTAHWNRPGRAALREEALQFFISCYNANAPKVCVENPFGYPCQAFRPASQIINPFDFGEPVRKRTCLWLRNLPMLFNGADLFGENLTMPCPPPEPVYIGVRKASGKPKPRHETDAMSSKLRTRRIQHGESFSPSKDRQKERSRTFTSIANAMAQQWGITQ